MTIFANFCRAFAMTWHLLSGAATSLISPGRGIQNSVLLTLSLQMHNFFDEKIMDTIVNRGGGKGGQLFNTLGI